ncbi:PrsW family intramembrane metalloprotease [Aeromicrobium tamlense]|uniref:PrsW family intramembrane metalloprotease n=1 Tax=Aeromicrobium tamlense TaxID=375541 RepID=A0A8I0FWV5_9ACTN|nr:MULTISPECIES: PrsW family intramembrane metalloprotease [Aeromicrobium]MBD1268879.1 PrsW family intramembrane metalloprotease [Aeromicrobium tamlense]NYI37214.1 RsiW-degrading membrane proteinase PrsW (M82 family) [Aeromicrobium tamlense]
MTTTEVQAALPAEDDPLRQRGRKLLVIAVWIAGVVGAGGAVFFASTSGSVAGASLALVYALIPLPVALAAYWWLDRVEPEPFRYKAAAFVWGAVIAVAIALPMEIGMSRLGMSEDWLIALGAPVAEELAKGLFVVLTLVRLRRIIDGVLDGLIVSGLVALGFAAMENVGYYAASYLGFDEVPYSGTEMATATFVVRGLFSPFAHPLFASAIGIAMGLAVHRSSRAQRWGLLALGYLASVALHALWNGSIVVGGGVGFLLAYVVLACLLLGLGITAVVLRMRQLDVLARALGDMARRGWIHPAEVPWLVRFARRRQARTFATQYGPLHAEAVERYQRLATEAAFLHDAVMTGRAKPAGPDRTYALLDRMWHLRPFLRFPPALPPGVR